MEKESVRFWLMMSAIGFSISFGATMARLQLEEQVLFELYKRFVYEPIEFGEPIEVQNPGDRV